MNTLNNILKPKTEEEIKKSLKNVSAQEVFELASKDFCVLKIFLETNPPKHLIYKILIKTSSTDKYNIVKLILDSENVPKEIIEHSIKNATNEKIIRLLLEYKEVEQSIYNHTLIFGASYGFYDIVKWILEHSKPSRNVIDTSFIAASTYGHIETKKLLEKILIF